MSNVPDPLNTSTPDEDDVIDPVVRDAVRSLSDAVPTTPEDVANAEQYLGANPQRLPDRLQSPERLIQRIRLAAPASLGAAGQQLPVTVEGGTAQVAIRPFQSQPTASRGFRFARRELVRAATAAGIIGALLGGGVLGTIVRSSYAETAEVLRQENALLREIHVAIRKLLGAFYLPNDDIASGTRGPAALLSARDRVTVTGLLDPQLIERVVVDWGTGEPAEREEVVYPSSSARATSRSDLVAFSRERRFALPIGSHLRVLIRAVPFADKRDVFAALGRDASWTERESVFLVTEAGLVVKPEVEWLLTSLEPDLIVRDDFVRIEGVANADGMLVGFFQAADQNNYLVLTPTPVHSGQRLPSISLDMGLFVNGTGNLVMQLLSEAQVAAADLRSQQPFRPYRKPLPVAEHRLDIPVKIDLEPLRERVARFAEAAGGSVKRFAPDGSNLTGDARHLALQWLDLTRCPISDIRRFRGISELQGLSLIATRVDDEGVAGLGKQHPKLQWLHLSETAITDRTVVNEVIHCGQLRSLDLHGNKGISNDSVEAIAEHLPHVTFLDLSGTSVTTIAPLKALTGPLRLRIASTAVPESELTELLQVNPKSKIDR